MLHRTSAPYPWFTRPAGAGSPAPRLQLFLAGSASIVTVTTGDDFVLSTVRTAAFQEPNTPWGGTGVPPNCQSPARLFGSNVVSLMNSAGKIGRLLRSV